MENKNALEKKLEMYIWEIKSLLRGSSRETSNLIALDLIFIQLLEIMKKDNRLNINDYIKGELNLIETKTDVEYEYAVEAFAKLNPIIGDLITDSIKTIRKCGEDVLTRNLRGYNFCFYDDIEDVGEFFKKAIYIINVNGRGHSDSYITPNSICKLIAVLLKDEEARDIFDQTVGSGCLLSEVAKYHKDAELFGQDIVSNSLKICEMLLILTGKFKSVENIKQGNTLTDPAFLESDFKIRNFDIVISDMPFAVRNYGFEIIKDDKYKRFHRGVPVKSMGDYAFITNLVESINENGTGAIIVPTGVLFRMSVDAKIRTSFIEENLIDCIIALPNNILSYTAIAINLIIFKKNRKSEEVLFIDASKEGVTDKKVTQLDDKAIDKIKLAYDNREDVEGFSKVVKREEIQENGYNLGVQKYVIPIIEREELDFDKLSLEAIEIGKKLGSIGDKLNSIFKS